MQGTEILIILLLALVVLGPKRLPEVARKLGSWAAELRTAARDITRGLEAEVAQFKEAADDVVAPMRELKADLAKDLEAVDPKKGFEWSGPKPISGPTPEDAMADLEEIERGGPPPEEAG
jgi:sec-independent protein translocase protein TatB